MLQKLTKKRNEKGFTLIELMIVIAIIGILAAIAIPNFIKYRKRSYDTSANADIKNLYTASQAYYTDNPAGSPTLDDLKAYGFRQTTNVTVAVTAATQDAFSATAAHDSGDNIYTVIWDGGITRAAKP